MTTTRFLSALFCVLAALPSCKSDGGTTPTARAPQASKKQPGNRAARAAPDAPPLVLPGTPHDAEHTRVVVRWTAAAGKVTVRAKPSGGAAAVDTLAVGRGETIAWTASRMIVRKPTTVTATKDATLGGAAAYDPSTGDVSQSTTVLHVPRGGTVSVYEYAAEGQCYVAYQGRFYVATCPDAASFEGADRLSMPRDMEWWLQIEEPAGWLQVDETKMDARAKSTL